MSIFSITDMTMAKKMHARLNKCIKEMGYEEMKTKSEGDSSVNKEIVIGLCHHHRHAPQL